MLYKKLSIIFSILIIFSCTLAAAAAPNETPEAVYYGTDNASATVDNLDYRDVAASDTWAREAIYETGALNLMKGYGGRQFGLKNSISKEQAIAIVYRAVGREADAQKAAEALNSTRQKQDRKANPMAMWADGYIQLAANEGLITQQDLKDALTQDQTTLDPAAFHRTAPAQRQELAFWFAKVLKLQPVYDQQKIFNSYLDWMSAEPVKIPYIEAILQNNIMNGDGNGHFSPTQTVTREQAAQIAKNAETLILPLLKYQKGTGTIENKVESNNSTTNGNITRDTFYIRNGNGKLNHIISESAGSDSGLRRNESNGDVLPGPERNFVVYKDGAVGKSDLLSMGDRIEYITAPDNTVKYVRVISSGSVPKYSVVRVNNIDTPNNQLNVTRIFDLDTPDINSAKNGANFSLNGENADTTYRYSSSATVEVDGGNSDIGGLQPNTYAILTLRDNIITAVKTVDFKTFNKEVGIIKGIVEDNNPQLGYITLYNEDGTGTSPDFQQQLILFRTYNYKTGGVEVFKNHKKAGLQDIEPGDSVFLKTDDDGNVTSVSAVDNYIVKFARVIYKKPATIAVEYDDGTQQVLDMDDKVPVIENKKLVGYSSLKDGGRVKLLLHETGKFTKIKEITVEGNEHFVSNIYKGSVSYIDDASGKLVAQNLEVLNNGQWVKTDQRGINGLKLSDGCKIFLNDSQIDIDKANRYARGATAYIAVRKDFGGNELAAHVDFVSDDDTEVLYDDSIAAGTVPGSGEFNLKQEYKNIKYGAGSIIIKDGRLVSGNSLSSEDKAYVVANRKYGSGEYQAGIVQIGPRTDVNLAQLYRGRIKQITDSRDFTIESFSQLKGNEWEYADTPKTFKLKNETRILNDSGIVNQRDFVGYGENSYAGKTVYILATDFNAAVVSDTPFGTINAKGEIFDITGATIGDEGTVTQEPTGLKLKNVKLYDLNNRVWTDGKDTTLSLLKNSIIFKGKQVLKPSELQKGDRIRVLKKDNTQTGDAYIIIVEG